MLISLLITILVLGLIYWVITAVLPIPAPFKTAALIIFAIICIIVLVGYLPMAPWHGSYLWR
jgi:hypothetical protein